MSEETVPAAADAGVEAEPLVEFSDFMKIQLRVAEIVEAEQVPKSKKLIKLQVDLGADHGRRQIIAGIAQFYEPEQLLGRKIVVVANLKPAQLMGLESQGMLLAAADGDSALILVDPGASMPVGAVVR